MKVEDLLEEVEFDKLGDRPTGLPYSFYEQFFHMRVAQYDILDFTRNPDYEPMEWPEDYWPTDTAPSSEKEWEELKESFFKERDEMMNLILDETNGLNKRLDHGDGQTLLRRPCLSSAQCISHRATGYHFPIVEVRCYRVNVSTL